MNIRDIDHIVITVDDLDVMTRFYHEVFDFPVIKETAEMNEFQLGHQKLMLTTDQDQNLLAPLHPTSGAARFCVIAKDSLTDVTNHLINYGVEIVKGPIKIRGANGQMNAIFVNDPEQNVIEICEYDRK